MADCKRKTALLNDNPLCGISTYKDTLDLSNGSVSRYMRKTIMTGTETITTQKDYYRNNTALFVYRIYTTGYSKRGSLNSHFVSITTNPQTTNYESSGFNDESTYSDFYYMRINYSTIGITGDESYADCVNAFKTWLAQQYANGTPVTIYYYVSTPTTETITVPSGLSGTEEGYLNRSGTPTPTNPIYPTANNVEIWQHSLRKLTTATDTLTTLPADVYADGNNATVGLQGNMQQTGTPSPTTPIQPSETGDKTANLLYSSQNQTVGSILHITQTIGNSSFILNKDVSQSDTSANIDIDVTLPAGTYTVSVIGLNLYNNDYDRLFIRDDNSTIVVQNVQVNRPRSFTLTETTHIYRLTVVGAAQSTYNNTNIQIMLNSGGTALPYQPYGYKIPISSASTTTPVYLGEVETTRKIKKLVLTGEENITARGGKQHTFGFSVTASLNAPCFCSHYTDISSSSQFDVVNGVYIRQTTFAYISDLNCDSVAAFKSFLASEYTSGTPVTIYYVLATPTTGIVNEPLRKIGDYADTVSGITIPTITGKDSFDVLTTLKPSEVSLAYTGWHDASVGEWDGSDWQ